MAKKQTPEKPPVLAGQLEELLTWCRRHPDTRKRIELGHGLRITCYVDAYGFAHLLLARDTPKGPSDAEAATVLKHWPEQRLAEVTWTRGHVKRVGWLAAAIQPPKQLKLFDPAPPAP